ncbi:ATP-binding cassette domain-containing protein [Marivibrio halodurans]|uniref:ATP-binding cassette domain-containing protein n=1 Tax=Marivibrio halodurans TaxID=2039722 RepID=A0A8J7S3V0_9PROT|nr:ATP-binding cassette domain-containing protein [Marivibrio halodurans]MBP5858073.1 ATP-binding cassette domain-containing protein [Marivibrio halodurans]
MATPVLTLSDIHLSLGGAPLLDGAELSVGPGDRLCLVGRNGSGKSTLLKIAAGAIEADRGERFVQPGKTVRYLAQEPDLSGHESLIDFVAEGLDPTDGPHRARRLLEKLGLDPEADPAPLSGGETRRAALARALAPRPDILLLDEPTNHLDLPTIEWLEGELKRLDGALVVVSHDRRFLDGLARAVVWLDRGRARRMEGGFAGFEDWRELIIAEEEEERRRLAKKIERETEWLHKGVTARRKRNMGRLRNLQALRAQRREAIGPSGTVTLTVGETQSSGKRVIEAEGLAKRYDGRAVVADFSIRILRGDRIGIVGPNGAGKTTLLNMLTGALAPDSGRVTHGSKLSIATLDQMRASLKPTVTLQEALAGEGEWVEIGGERKHVRSYMQDFLFQPNQAGTPIGKLSGGERGRLMLARALAQPANLLVLDEPTNDLDLETLDLLQEMIADHPGTVLLVSHDRDFLDRTVTATVNAEGEGHWRVYAGGFADMRAQGGILLTREGAAETPKPAAKPKAANGGAAEKPKAKTKQARLSFTERHRLEALPGEIEALEAKIAPLRETIADPNLYARDPRAFAKASEALAKAEEALAAAEEEWLRLEDLREAEEAGT